MKLLCSFALLLTLNTNLKADLLGTDIAWLIEIASTTASQLNELERLVTNAEKHTKTIEKYNEIIMDKYFRAQRILLVTEDLIGSKDSKIEDLGSLNEAIRRLKYSMISLKDHVYDIRRENKFISTNEMSFEDVNKSLKRDEKIVNFQLDRSSRKKSLPSATNQIVQNTAITNKQLLDSKRLQLKNLEVNNKILRHQNIDEQRKIQEKIDSKKMITGRSRYYPGERP